MLNGLDSQSLLMLYVADELSATQRKTVERMLENDPKLREQLAELTDANDGFEAAMARADATPITGQAGAVRRIGQVMRQRIARDLVKPVEREPRIAMPRYPWWAYGAVS